MVSDQIYRNQRDNNVMIGILSHIVEFRNSESAQHVLQVQTVTGMLLRRLSEKTDVYHLTEEKIRLIVPPPPCTTSARSAFPRASSTSRAA